MLHRRGGAAPARPRGRRGVERVAEIGTGVGTGTAWLAAALAPGTPLYTAEADDALADAAEALFAGDPDVLVLRGDWRAVLPPHAPYDLVFADGGRAKDDRDAVLGLAAPGATVVLDDFSADWPRPDERRERWLAHPRMTAVELGTGQGRTAIVGVVRR